MAGDDLSEIILILGQEILLIFVKEMDDASFLCIPLKVILLLLGYRFESGKTVLQMWF